MTARPSHSLSLFYGERNVEYANEARRYLILLETFISSATRLELSESRYGQYGPSAAGRLFSHTPQ